MAQLLQSTAPGSGTTIITLPPDPITCDTDELPFRRFPFNCVISMNDTSTWPIIYKGQEYAGIASTHPVFIPHPAFLVINPIWTQCSCVYGCFRCVYDGATLCAGCPSLHINTYCDCEPGCCGIPPESSGSSGNESTTTGSASTQSSLDHALSHQGFATEQATARREPSTTDEEEEKGPAPLSTCALGSATEQTTSQ